MVLWPHPGPLQSPDGQRAASLAPCSNGGNIVFALQSSALALGELQTLTEWQFGRTFYTLPGYHHSNEANRIITELVAARSFPGGSPLQMDPSAVVEGLCSDGWIVPTGNSLCLSEHGMHKLEVGRVCCRPRLCAIPRLQPLQDLSDWELIQHLAEQGWLWAKYNPRKSLPYRRGGPLVWQSSGASDRSVIKEYLLVLLRFVELQSQYPSLTMVPHGRPRATYSDMLNGIAAPEALDLVDLEAGAPGKLVGSGVLEFEPLTDEPLHPGSAAPVEDDGDLLVDLNDFLDGSQSDGWESDTGQPAQPATSGRTEARESPEDPNATPTGSPMRSFAAAPADPGVHAAMPVANLPPPSPQTPVASEVPVVGARGPRTSSDTDHRKANHAWGLFRITWRQASRTCAHGSWFARCRFHRKSSSTYCSRVVTVKSGTDEASIEALHQLYHWCNMAPQHNRKWKQKLVSRDTLEALPLDILTAQQPAQLPPIVHDDDYLDGLGTDVSHAAIPKARAAKARGKAKPSGRSRSAPAASAPSSASSSSSSCSSSSSSSSGSVLYSAASSSSSADSSRGCQPWASLSD